MQDWIASLPPVSEAAVFFDFDGTLVELAATPDAIDVPDDLTELLHALLDTTSGALALVTGRSLANLAGHLPDFRGTIVGGHGAERRHAGAVIRHPMAGSPVLKAAQEDMARFAQARQGLLFEPKPTGGVVHYRRAPEREEETRAFVQDLARHSAGLAWHPAKMAEEIRPDGIGKDRAVTDLMSAPPFQGRRPVFFGDDTTDEPAMDICLKTGGLAVKVGPGPTCASLRLDSPAALREGLASWLG